MNVRVLDFYSVVNVVSSAYVSDPGMQDGVNIVDTVESTHVHTCTSMSVMQPMEGTRLKI